MSDHDPHHARLHVCITFLYRKERLRYLFDSVLSFAGFDVESIEIVICTDTDDPETLTALRTLFDKFTGTCFSVRFASFPEVHRRNPRELAWTHKQIQRDAFTQGSGRYTHFLMLEDDIIFTEANFRYFCRYRDALGAHGLLPGLIRLEFNYQEQDVFASDQHGRQNFDAQNRVTIAGVTFVSLGFPYMAMYVLDRMLMQEYLDSASFDMETSRQRSGWGLMERAAMGLTWEQVPAGFASRQAVPMKPGTHMPQPMSWIYHAPNNYTNNYDPGPNYVCGKTRMDRIFET